MHQPDTSPLRLLGCRFMTSTEGWRSDQWVIGTGRYEKKAYSGDQIYTTDPIRYDAWFASDRVTPNDARIGGMSRKWVAQACRASDEMLARAPTLKVPVMVLQSVEDDAVVPAAQDRFCQAIPMPANVPPSAPGCHPQGLPISYADAKHELLIERDEIRMDAMRRTLAFFSQQRAVAKSNATGP
jgi:lysophospholipase